MNAHNAENAGALVTDDADVMGGSKLEWWQQELEDEARGNGSKRCRDRQYGAARSRALFRLKNLHFDEYKTLLAEERSRG